MERKAKKIRFVIDLHMDFPEDWDNDMIWFHLNESSWCADNLIDLLKEHSKKNGCICDICNAEVM